MNIIDIIDKKRLGNKLNKEEIKYVVNSYLNKEITDYQMSSLLMAICINNLDIEEIYDLTSEYINSGIILDLSSISKPIVDKHSTGGIGDKISLIVVPLVASCNVIVPKMSGKGLGITGGTIDKLESISNFNTEFNLEIFIKQLKDINCSIVKSNKDIVPADKEIYALRDVSGTTSSIGLITASILSKKIACGSKNIVIDVKYGNLALMKNHYEAKLLSKTLVSVGKKFNLNIMCIISNMDNPLGNKIGNSLEVEEAIDTLLNNGPKDLTNLSIYIASYMVSISKNISYKEANNEVKSNLKNHLAYNKFIEMIEYQGGNLEPINKINYKYTVTSSNSGYVTEFNVNKLHNLNLLLKVVRNNKEDDLNYNNGLEIKKKIGDYVKKDEPIMIIYSMNKIEDFNQYENIYILGTKKKKISLIKGVLK